MRWRVPLRVAVGKLIIGAMLVLLALVAATEVWQTLMALAAATGAAAWAARDLLVPVRLAADGDGLTLVVGLAGRRQLPWSQVDRVRVDVRRRSRMLEVDVGETLYLFSRYDLDADLDEVASRLEEMRLAAR
jgi:hypothetical protein